MISVHVNIKVVLHLSFPLPAYMQVPPPEKKQRKETLLSAELGKYVDKKVRVKFQGGREGMDEDKIIELRLLHFDIIPCSNWYFKGI